MRRCSQNSAIRPSHGTQKQQIVPIYKVKTVQKVVSGCHRLADFRLGLIKYKSSDDLQKYTKRVSHKHRMFLLKILIMSEKIYFKQMSHCKQFTSNSTLKCLFNNLSTHELEFLDSFFKLILLLSRKMLVMQFPYMESV